MIRTVEIPCDTRVCGEKSLANDDVRFWYTQSSAAPLQVASCLLRKTVYPKSPETTPIRDFPSAIHGSAANGVLRDGGLSKSKDIRGKRPFSSVFWIFQVLFGPSKKGQKRQKKAEKARFWPISGTGGQTPLKPPFVTPPFAALPKFTDGEGFFAESSAGILRKVCGHFAEISGCFSAMTPLPSDPISEFLIPRKPGIAPKSSSTSHCIHFKRHRKPSFPEVPQMSPEFALIMAENCRSSKIHPFF